MEYAMSMGLTRANAKAMRQVLLALAVCGLPGLAAYAATHKPASKAVGAGKIAIDGGSRRAFLAAPPGAKPVPLALRLSNSGGARSYVTRLAVAVARSPARCRAAANLRIVQSNVSHRHPVRVPGRGSVTLPAQGVSAPTIQLVNRPVNQDGCKGARFPLRFTFTYSAHR
jgi:hypothetical protein